MPRLTKKWWGHGHPRTPQLCCCTYDFNFPKFLMNCCRQAHDAVTFGDDWNVLITYCLSFYTWIGCCNNYGVGLTTLHWKVFSKVEGPVVIYGVWGGGSEIFLGWRGWRNFSRGITWLLGKWRGSQSSRTEYKGGWDCRKLTGNTPYSKMAAVSDDLGRVAWKRGIEGQTVVFMPQNCCVPGCKKKVYVENGVKISFHTFPEERKLFMKCIVAIRRDIVARDISSHRIIFLHLRGVKGL